VSNPLRREEPRVPAFLRGVEPLRPAQQPPFLVVEERAPEPPPAREVETPAPPPPPPPAPVAPPPPPPPPAEPPAELLARYAASIEALRLQGERLAAQARADALEIGFQVARRILEFELSTSAEPLFALIRSAIRRIGESRILTLRLHPTDLAAVEAAGGPGAVAPTLAQVRLEADATLQRGDCIVDTGVAQVDGRLETRLGELQRAVAELAEGRG